jgi:hypothetical protein
MTLSTLRRWHAYIGLFIAPSVLFFAFTGAIQIFNLHEAHGGYHPAAWVEKLSSVHKDQVFRQPHEHDHPDQQPVTAGAPAGPPADDDAQMSVGTLALKWFFLLVALALTVSTLIGIWLGITQLRRWLLAWILLAAGALIPLALLI